MFWCISEDLELGPRWCILVLQTISRIARQSLCGGEGSVRPHLITVAVWYARHAVGHLIGHHWQLHLCEIVHVSIVRGVSVVLGAIRVGLSVGHLVRRPLHATRVGVHQLVHRSQTGRVPDGSRVHPAAPVRGSAHRGRLVRHWRGDLRRRGTLRLLLGRLRLLRGVGLPALLLFALLFLGFLLLSAFSSSVFEPHLKGKNTQC